MVISVVIVTYNNHAEIGACLDALHLASASFTTHLFLTDNASTDGTGELLEEYRSRCASHFHRFLVIRNGQNRGFTAAVNQGLLHCRGDFFLLLNPDVVIPEGALAVLLRQFERDPAIGVVAPQLRFPDGRIQPSCRRFPRRRDVLLEVSGLVHLARRLGFKDWKMTDFDHRHSRFVDQPQGAFLLARQELLDRLGGLDERYFMFFSDVEWCERVIASGWKIWFCSDTFVRHHKGASVYRERPRMLVTSTRSFIDYLSAHDRSRCDRFATAVVALILKLTLQVRLLAEKARETLTP